jgi:enoyl-CoA hydratase
MRQIKGAAAMAYETLIVDVKDYAAVITLHRPDAMNALNTKMMQELAQAMTAAAGDDAVRCIVLTGSEKAFAAGADVREMAEKGFADVFFDDLFVREAEEISRVRKPIIAAVAGYCLGGGCELALMADFIIAADSAKFGQPEINLGIVAGMGGTQRLTRAVGKAKSMDMHLTGRFMDAAEAERSGLVSRVVPAASLMDEVMKAAARIAEKSRLTAMVVKESVNRAQETTLAEGLMFERRMFHAMFATEDQKEGMSAFLEKRQPQFRDR